MRICGVFLTIVILCCVSQQGLAQQANSDAISTAGVAMRVIPLSESLPAAPPGYKWKSCVEGQVEILIPSNWEVQSRRGKNVVQCAAAEHLKVTPAEFSGLEVCVYVKPAIPGVQTPSDFADKMMSNIRSKAKSYRETKADDSRFAYRDADIEDGDDKGIIAYATHKSTGNVVQIILTSPSQRWTEIESKGRITIRNISVSPSI